MSSDPVSLDLPGVSSAGTSIADVLPAVLQAISQVAPTHRQCHITITNGCSSFYLSNPRWYIDSGSCATPFPPTIRSSDSGSALFIKTPDTARGAIAVITYDLLNNDSNQTIEKIAVMFSNPYDLKAHSNLFAVGILDNSRECDKLLYDEMETGTGNFFVRRKTDGNVLSYRGKRVTIQATMSDSPQPAMKVELRETQ
uniref:Uncharacterized protein n=1 Tax=Salarias fasciatus TaxID=181472 RepID=A0A672FHB5_SALFA